MGLKISKINWKSKHTWIKSAKNTARFVIKKGVGVMNNKELLLTKEQLKELEA